MPVTDQQARALAFLACAARPTGAKQWDEAGVLANIAKVADRALGSVVLAVIQAAEDRNAATPGVIPTAGPHWRAPESAPTPTREPFNRRTTCGTCGRGQTQHPADHPFKSLEAERAVVVDVAARAAAARSTLSARPSSTPAPEEV